MVQFKKGYDDDENRKQKLELAKKMQEALENTYSDVVAQSQEPLTREQNYNVSHLVCGLPKKGRTRWMGVGAQRVSTQFQPPSISTPSGPSGPSYMPSGPSYMPQEDCTQQAMHLVSSVMNMLDGQIPEEMWEDIQEELMRVIQPTATFAMVSRQIMKSCRRRVPTRVQSQIMSFLATQRAFTGSGEGSMQSGDDAIGSTSRRDGSTSGNADDDMDRADDLS